MVPRVVPFAHVVAPLLALSVCATPWLSTVATGQTPGIREVSASARSVTPVQTRLRYTTMIVLPLGSSGGPIWYSRTRRCTSSST